MMEALFIILQILAGLILIGLIIVCLRTKFFPSTLVEKWRELEEKQVRIEQEYRISEVNKFLENKRLEYLGKKVNNRNEALYIMQDLLSPIHNINREGLIIFFLDNSNTVVDVKITIGETFSVQSSPTEIVDFAKANNSKKIVVGHNHTIQNAVPSDADVSHGASLYLLSKERGITLVDDLVLCGSELKSLLNTHRFKQMIRGY